MSGVVWVFCPFSECCFVLFVLLQVMKSWKHSCRFSVIIFPRSSTPLKPSPWIFLFSFSSLIFHPPTFFPLFLFVLFSFLSFFPTTPPSFSPLFFAHLFYFCLFCVRVCIFIRMCVQICSFHVCLRLGGKKFGHPAGMKKSKLKNVMRNEPKTMKISTVKLVNQETVSRLQLGVWVSW